MSSPEEKFDESVWHILKKIKERSLYTDTEKRVPYFVISDLRDNLLPPDDEIAILKKLHRQGVIKLTSPDSVDLMRPDLYIEIIKPAFDQLCEFHKIFTDGRERVKDKTDNTNSIELKSLGVKYDNEKAILEIGNQRCQLPPYKNEHYFCRSMYEHGVSEPIDWSVIYEKMTGYYEAFYGKPQRTRENWRLVYDAMEALNKRLKELTGTKDNLFSWQEKTIKRNY
ncbi:MAG: hypothetical protein UX30_C0014G0004 [Candidatus Saccharibacteria bacterium GW2011_GWA2_46_10]|nr:MAG: hypothetical protein UX30_C0014G0004 [Candidatus Saccharibacteria bacterium GW2011_GWA2_46_10]